MADENDPDRPEDDLPVSPPSEGENAAEPVEATAGEPAPIDDPHREELFEETAAADGTPTPPPPESLPPIPDDLPISAAARVQEEEIARAAPPPPTPEGDLPPRYFRAAGDPEEAQEEPPASLLGRIEQRITDTARDAWRAIEPKWVAFAGGTRAFGGEMWRRIRGIKHPRNVREAAVWSGWAAAGVVGLIVAFFVMITWDLPSTDDLW
ncbi:MAG: hypothetical protein ABL889_07095, partial [Terricaulis sp.]